MKFSTPCLMKRPAVIVALLLGALTNVNAGPAKTETGHRLAA